MNLWWICFWLHKGQTSATNTHWNQIWNVGKEPSGIPRICNQIPCRFKRSAVFWPPATNCLRSRSTLPLQSRQPVERRAKWNIPRAHCFLRDHLYRGIFPLDHQSSPNYDNLFSTHHPVSAVSPCSYWRWPYLLYLEATQAESSLADEWLCGTMKIPWFFQQLAEYLKPGVAIKIKSLKQEIAPPSGNDILCMY